MSKPRVNVALAFVVVIALGATASVAVSALSTPKEPQDFIQAVNANAGKSYPVVRANGGDPSQARAIGRTSRGIAISVVKSADGRCVLFSDANQFCATDSQVAEGHSSRVDNDCSRAGGAMSITAVMPGGTSSARIRMSDGTTVPMQVADDVAWLDTSVPTANQAAYLTAAALDAEGRQLSEVKLPRDLCPGGTTPDR
jgi:hypothetical protein